MGNDNEFNKWSEYIIQGIKELKEGQKGNSRQIAGISQEIAALKVKASVSGALGGLFATAIAIGSIIIIFSLKVSFLI